MATLRQRTKHVNKDSDDEEPAPILNAEEQEKTIDELKRKSTLFNAVKIWLSRATVAWSLEIQLQFLFDTSGRHPLTTILPARMENTLPLIAFTKVFTLLLIWIHIHVNQLFLTTSLPFKVKLGRMQTFILSNLALAVAFVTRTTDFAQLFWWAVPSLLMALDAAVRWMHESEGSVAQLEKLKYDAKSA